MKEKIPQFNESESFFQEAQKLATKTKETLKIVYGLTTLSNIEFVGLRRIAGEVLNDLKVNKASKKSWDNFTPEIETANRFLDEFFSVKGSDFYYDLGGIEDEEDWDNRYDKQEKNMKTYLKIKQEKSHKP